MAAAMHGSSGAMKRMQRNIAHQTSHTCSHLPAATSGRRAAACSAVLGSMRPGTAHPTSATLPPSTAFFCGQRLSSAQSSPAAQSRCLHTCSTQYNQSSSTPVFARPDTAGSSLTSITVAVYMVLTAIVGMRSAALETELAVVTPNRLDGISENVR